MKTRINSVEGISLRDRCQIIKDYIEQRNDNGNPKVTKKGCGTKIQSCGRRYHVSCTKSPTSWIFTIWWGV